MVPNFNCQTLLSAITDFRTKTDHNYCLAALCKMKTAADFRSDITKRDRDHIQYVFDAMVELLDVVYDK